MAYTVVGLFPSQEQAETISRELEKAGIKNNDYIVYKTDISANVEETPTIWSRLFGNRKPAFISTETDKLITSVAISSEDEMRKVENIFQENEVVHTYEFQDMTIEEAKDLNYIKKIVELRAKSHIYAMPEITTSQSNSHVGISSEVKA